MINASGQVEAVTSFIVMDILETAREMDRDGADVIHLEIGEPDFSPPRAVVEALCRAARDGYAFAYRLLREARVAATPGVDFGSNETAHSLRFSYTAEESRIEEGISRMARWLGV
jgi:aspartate/methionine/tyrosine aminotransferase